MTAGPEGCEGKRHDETTMTIIPVGALRLFGLARSGRRHHIVDWWGVQNTWSSNRCAE
jgi:hypothetical protein